jgi:hypothetical protein
MWRPGNVGAVARGGATMLRRAVLMVMLSSIVAALSPGVAARAQGDPPALNPFGASAKAGHRPDAIRGAVVLSDGSRHGGQVHLTRDARLRVYDATTKRVREVPLSAVRRVECRVTKEWLEPEWRFEANASDRKVFTGRSYPARTYAHTITLKDGRSISGPLSAIVYVKTEGDAEARRFLLHDRDKGDVGKGLKDLIFVKTIELTPPDAKAPSSSSASSPQPAPGG